MRLARRSEEWRGRDDGQYHRGSAIAVGFLPLENARNTVVSCDDSASISVLWLAVRRSGGVRAVAGEATDVTLEGELCAGEVTRPEYAAINDAC